MEKNLIYYLFVLLKTISILELPRWKKTSKPRNSKLVKIIIANSCGIFYNKESNSGCCFNAYQVWVCIKYQEVNYLRCKNVELKYNLL